MAKDEDSRTPEQIEAYAKECLRMAEETRRQGEAVLKTADDWEKLAGDQTMLARQMRGRSVPDTPAPKKAATKSGSRK